MLEPQTETRRDTEGRREARHREQDTADHMETRRQTTRDRNREDTLTSGGAAAAMCTSIHFGGAFQRKPVRPKEIPVAVLWTPDE